MVFNMYETSPLLGFYLEMNRIDQLLIDLQKTIKKLPENNKIEWLEYDEDNEIQKDFEIETQNIFEMEKGIEEDEAEEKEIQKQIQKQEDLKNVPETNIFDLPTDLKNLILDFKQIELTVKQTGKKHLFECRYSETTKQKDLATIPRNIKTICRGHLGRLYNPNLLVWNSLSGIPEYMKSRARNEPFGYQDKDEILYDCFLAKQDGIKFQDISRSKIRRMKKQDLINEYHSIDKEGLDAGLYYKYIRNKPPILTYEHLKSPEDLQKFI